jgi:hypothetical protein
VPVRYIFALDTSIGGASPIEKKVMMKQIETVFFGHRRVTQSDLRCGEK